MPTDFQFAPASTWGPTACIGISCLLVGIAVSSATYSLVESSVSVEQRGTISKLRSQVAALQSAVHAHSTALSSPLEVDPIPAGPVMAAQKPSPPPSPQTDQPSEVTTASAVPRLQEAPLATAPKPAVPAKASSPPVPAQAPVARQEKPVEQSVQPSKLAVDAKSSLVSQNSNAVTSTSSAPVAAPPLQPTSAPAMVTAEEISQAEKNAIEFAPGSKMGVGKIEAGAVVMKSGTRIRTGERFSSGEKLLTVDLETGKIVTSRRTIMLIQ